MPFQIILLIVHYASDIVLCGSISLITISYPEMAHINAVILFFFFVFFFHIEFQRCLIYSKNRCDYNMHFSGNKH